MKTIDLRERLFALVNLSIVIFIVISIDISEYEINTNILLIYLSASNCFVQIYFLGNRDIFSPQHIYPIIYTIIFSFCDFYPSPFYLTPTTRGRILVTGSLAFYLIGSSLFGVNKYELKSKHCHNVSEKLCIALRAKFLRHFLLFSYLLMVLGLAAWRIQCNFPLFESDVENYRIAVRSNIRFYAIIFYCCLLAEIIPAWTLIYYIVKKNRNPVCWSILYNIPTFLTLFLWGDRGRVVDGILIYTATYHYLRANISVARLFLGGFVVLFLVALMGLMRAHTSGVEAQAYILSRIAQEFNVNVSNLERIIQYFPDHKEYLKGMYTFYPLYTLLPGHQPSMPLLLKEWLDLKFQGGGMTPTIIGSFYADYGLICSFFGMFVVGYLSNYVYMKMYKNVFPTLAYPFFIVFSLEFIRNANVINYILMFFCFLTILMIRYSSIHSYASHKMCAKLPAGY